MKKIRTAVKVLVFSYILLALVLLLMPRPHFEMEPERPHFWSYPKVSDAKFSSEITDDGKILLKIEHPLLKGVTPEMLSWWYRHLASGKYIVEQKEYTFYHLFHLSEHGQTRIIKPAIDGSAGMGVGAVVYRQERFGPYLSKGMGRVESFSNRGFVIVPIFGPLDQGRIEHSFEAQGRDTLYRVNTVLGSDDFILGPLFNLYLRKRLFSPEVLNEWVRHQVEEVGSLVHFLPKIYRELGHK